jgi:hypothetical protein
VSGWLRARRRHCDEQGDADGAPPTGQPDADCTDMRIDALDPLTQARARVELHRLDLPRLEVLELLWRGVGVLLALTAVLSLFSLWCVRRRLV